MAKAVCSAAGTAPTVMHLEKAAGGDSALLNQMVMAGDGSFRTLVCYLSGRQHAANKIDDFADKSLLLKLEKKQLKARRLGTLKAVATVIDEESVDLLVCQFRRQIAIGLLAGRLSKRKPKVIAVLHGIVGGKIGLGRKLSNYLFYRGLARLVSVSESGVDDIIRLNWGLDRERISAIPNGIDFTPYTHLAPLAKTEVFGAGFAATLVFGAVGRLTDVKNLQRTLRGFAIASQKRPEIRLVFAGQGRQRSALEQLTAELQLQEKVFFLGQRDDITGILAALDVFVMPSLREGLPRALLEAMGTGLPVLTSNCSGMKEVVGEAQCGRLVDPLDVTDIASAFVALASASDQDRRNMGRASRERVINTFSATRMAAAYAQLYREILAE